VNNFGGSGGGLFRNAGCSPQLSVIHPQGRLLGLVSRTDALRRQINRNRDQTSFADAVSDAAQPAVYPETPSGVVADLITESGIGRIAISDPGSRHVLGILSRQDLLKTRSANRRAEVGRSRYVGSKPEVGPRETTA
jgi:CBS domain-containing protein